MVPPALPPRQQLVAAGKWPTVGETAPAAWREPWQVAMAGFVERPCVWSVAELCALPQVEHVVDIHCVTRWSKLGVTFGGVPLAALLKSAGVQRQARFVSFVAHSERDHSTSLMLDDALRLDTLIALSIDGRPVPIERGGPVRVVVPGRYFYKSLKWLARIELLEHDRLGYWESTAGYHNVADPWREQRYIASGLSKQEAARRIASRDFSGADLPGIDAAGRDLTGLNARGAILRDADFRRCQLESACFDGANLSNADFRGADLRDATFMGADVEGADFSGADLRGADLRVASLLGVSFVAEEPEHAAARFDGATRFDPSTLAGLTPEQEAYVRKTHENR